MTVYYFHLCNGSDILMDSEGRELKGLPQVVAMALNEARAIISADARDGRILLDQHLNIEDGQRTVVHQLQFVDAVEIIMPRK